MYKNAKMADNSYKQTGVPGYFHSVHRRNGVGYMKKDVMKQILVLLGLTAVLTGLFFAGYHYGNEIGGNEIITMDSETYYMQGETDEEILDSYAKYVIESHDLDSDSLRTESDKIPVEFIGLSRSEIIDYITSHKEQFQEEGEEIRNISMISFSSDMLVLRKDVTKSVAISETVKKYENDNPYNYYMVLEEGYIVVYKQDKSTIFLETGIGEEELDESERELLIQGIGVKNVSELYRYLEGYTS